MQAWEQFLSALESDLGADTVNKWLRPLKVLHFDAGNLYLEATDSFQLSWFEEHIRARARKMFVNNNYNPIKIHLSGPVDSFYKEKSISPTRATSSHHSTAPSSLTKDTLDPDATLTSFITTDKNTLAVSLLHSLLEQDNQAVLYNPIYLYGPAGTGKSHLLMAITKELQAKGLRALYVKMDTFTENVVSAIRSGNMHSFRHMVRDVDALIVDDMQVLAKKTATQEEFFHTFNTLHTSGRQIILSANSPPFMLQDIEPRLTSRFEWGITLSLGILEKEEISQIIHKRLQKLSLLLDDKTLEHLLSSFSYHLSSLHKAVDALALRASQSQTCQIDIPSLNRLLSDLLQSKEKSLLTPQKIIQAVAEHYGIKIEDILGRSQNQEYTQPRQIAMYLCREKMKAPFTQIGQFFKRDHSTVMSSVNLIKEKLLKKEMSFPSDLCLIQKKLDG